MRINDLQSNFMQFNKPVLSSVYFVPKDKEKIELPYINTMTVNTKLIKAKKIKTKQRKFIEGVVILTLSNFKDPQKALKNIKIPYLLTISMKGTFRWSTKLDEQQVKELVKVNASSLLFSYLRPIVAELTSNSDFKREDLPFIDFTKSKENF